MPQSSATFQRNLVSWRKFERISQAALAAELKVSQQAVSMWERGADRPSPAKMAEIRALMAKTDPVRFELAFIRQQQSIRTLFDTDGVRMIGYSEGFAKVWPQFTRFENYALEDHLVGEVAAMMGSREIRQGIIGGEIAMASGVSDRHANIDADTAFRHRWFVGFRRYGWRVVGDMVFEACDPSTPTGIETLLRVDEITS
jgi:transcriptional regulator with XRE-family HTH domain